MFFSDKYFKFVPSMIWFRRNGHRHLVAFISLLSLLGCEYQLNVLQNFELSRSSTNLIASAATRGAVHISAEPSEPTAAKVKHIKQPITTSIQPVATEKDAIYSSPTEIIGLVRSFVPNGEILNIDTSADGKALVFESSASNLVRGDTNQTTDIFLMLAEQRLLKRISIDSLGNQVEGNSVNPRISPDGGWVVYESSARGLDPRDQNQFKDIYLHEVGTGTTKLVSVSLSGSAGNRDSRNPVVSRDAEIIAFESEATNLIENDENKSSDVFVYNKLFESVNLVSLPVRESGEEALQKNMASYRPDLSDDGLYVAYESFSPNLTLDDYNSNSDIFLHSLVDQSTLLISKFGPKGAEVAGDSTNSSISADGNTIVFQSLAQILKTDTNDVHDTYIYEVSENKLARLPAEELYLDDTVRFVGSYDPVISGDGSFVVYQANFSAKTDEDLLRSYGAHLAFYDISDSTAGRIKLFEADDRAVNNVQGYSVSLSIDAEVLAFHVSHLDNSQSGRLTSKSGWLSNKREQNGSDKESVDM